MSGCIGGLVIGVRYQKKWFAPYPPAGDDPTTDALPFVRDPVNQVPYLEGWTDADGINHRGWMVDLCTFAHELVTWDDRQLRRLHPQAHTYAPDIGHDADSRHRAKQAIRYGSILLGNGYDRLSKWGNIPITETRQYFTWQDTKSPIEWVMDRLCGVRGECTNPHWITDLALNTDPDTIEDALAEQAQNDRGSRQVFIPMIVKNDPVRADMAEGLRWRAGRISNSGEVIANFSTGLNPVREWDRLMVHFAAACKRYRERYSSRHDELIPHTHRPQ